MAWLDIFPYDSLTRHTSIDRYPRRCGSHVSLGRSSENRASSILWPPSAHIKHSLGALNFLRSHARTSPIVHPENEKLARSTRLEADLYSAKTYRQKRNAHKQLYLLHANLDVEAERRAALFDSELVKKRLHDLESARKADDLPHMLHLIRTQLTRDLGWMCNPELFHHPGVGAEDSVRRYQKAVTDTLDSIVAAGKRNDRRLLKSLAREELNDTLRSFGRVALLCSGGGTMGMAHIGVIKSLYEVGRLPRVISGSSAGAIVCAVLCSRTDNELPLVLEQFCHGDLAVFIGEDESPGLFGRIQYWRQNGYGFDSKNLERVMKQHLGDMTFQEAYSRTGRILNITVSNADDRYQSCRVLNYINAGTVVIWSAVVASCALPYGFKPAKLVSKDSTTKILTVCDDTEYIDGSIDGDIPLLQMSQQFGCNYFIVAQANPHVLTGIRLKEVLGLGLHPSLSESIVSSAMDEIVNALLPCGSIARRIAGLIDQPYAGNVTIRPDLELSKIWRILANPTPLFMDESKEIGEKATYPFLSMIKNHVKIERALDQACKDLAAACHFSDSQSDLRRLHLAQKAHPRENRGRKRSKHDLNLLSHGCTAEIIQVPSRSGRTARSDVFNGIGVPYPGLVNRPEHTSWPVAEYQVNVAAATDDDSYEENKEDSATSVTPPAGGSDNDSDLEPDLEALVLKCCSCPSSPRPTTAAFFEPLTRTRSQSPVAPVSLMMTPAQDHRSASPAMARTGRRDCRVPRSPTPGVKERRPLPSDGWQSLKSRRDHDSQLELPLTSKARRSLSTGRPGVRQ